MHSGEGANEGGLSTFSCLVLKLMILKWQSEPAEPWCQASTGKGGGDANTY